VGDLGWEDLPRPVRDAVAGQVGDVTGAESASKGSASDVATTLITAAGRMFLKASRLTDSDDVRRIEARVQPHLPPVAPRLLFHTETGGWLALVYEHVSGRPANLAPGSADLPAIARTLTELSRTLRPTLPVLPVELRWKPFAEPDALALLSGNTLLHMDLTAENILIGDQVRIVDWAWPSRGAAWLDTAAWVVRLIQAGHAPAAAESWARRVPAWSTASTSALQTHARIRTALCRTADHRALRQALDIWQRYLSN
jgi:hypothetical protein